MLAETWQGKLNCSSKVSFCADTFGHHTFVSPQVFKFELF